MHQKKRFQLSKKHLSKNWRAVNIPVATGRLFLSNFSNCIRQYVYFCVHHVYGGHLNLFFGGTHERFRKIQLFL